LFENFYFCGVNFFKKKIIFVCCQESFFGKNYILGYNVDKILVEEVPLCTTALAEGAYLAQWRYKESERAKMPKLIEPIGGAKDDWMAGLNAAKGAVVKFLRSGNLEN